MISNSCKPTQCFYHLNNSPLEIVDSLQVLGSKYHFKAVMEWAHCWNIHQSISHPQSAETLDAWMYAISQSPCLHLTGTSSTGNLCTNMVSPWERIQGATRESSGEGCEMDLWCHMGQKTVSMDIASQGLSLKAWPTNNWETLSTACHAAKYIKKSGLPQIQWLLHIQ